MSLPPPPPDNSKPSSASAGNKNNKEPGPKTSEFWLKYIERQKAQKANPSSQLPQQPSPSKKKSKPPFKDANNNDNNNDPKDKDSTKTKEFNPIKIKSKDEISRSVSLVERKRNEYQKKLQNTTNLLILLLRADRRIQGRKYHITYIVSMKSREDPKKKNYYVICLLLYQCLLGAFGGIVVGFQTKFLSPNRFGEPNIPLPNSWNLPMTKQTAAMGIKMSSVLWRMAKRGVIAGILFDNIDRHIEMNRNKRDWKSTAMAGAICGSLFGFRGGFHGPFQCALSFGLIGGLGGYFFINKPSPDNKLASGFKSQSRWSS